MSFKKIADTSFKDKIPEDQIKEETKKEIQKIKEIEKMINREDLIFKTGENTNNFQQFEKRISFAENVFSSKTTLNNADEDQANLLVEFIK